MYVYKRKTTLKINITELEGAVTFNQLIWLIERERLLTSKI